jgi:hypothetical protein
MFVSAYVGRLIDSLSRAVLNAQVQRNRHCWKQSVSVHAMNVLEAFAKHLKRAWETDKEYPKSYPVNTGSVCFQINKRLAQGSRGGSQIKPPRKTIPPVPSPPERFSDLVDEKIIRTVFEQQNDGSYDYALKLAACGDTNGTSAWRKILLAVNASSTGAARFERHFVAAGQVTAVLPHREWLARDAMTLRVNGSLSLGVAGRCCALIGASPLDRELAACRMELDLATAERMPAARAAAAELAIRAAAALVAVQGSRAILAGQHAQRLAREALFLLVFASRPGIKAHLVGRLTGAATVG